MEVSWIRTRDASAVGGMTAGRILVVLAMLTAAAPLSIDIYTPSLPTIQAELGGGAWLSQASITACLLGIGFGQLLWGPLSEKTGRRPIIMIGVIGWALTSVLSALSPSPEFLIISRGLAGICGAAGIVVSRTVVSDISATPAILASRIGVLTSVTAVAPVIAPVVGAGIAALLGWRGDFMVLAAFGGATALAFGLLVPETLPPARRATGGSLRSVRAALREALRNRQLVGVALALAAHAVGFYAYIATASFVVEKQFGYPPVVFALVFGTNAVAMLCANMGFRRLVLRHHPRLPLGIGLAACTLAGLLLVLFSLAHSPAWSLWVAAMLFASGTGFVLPGSHSWGQLTPVTSGAASALTGSAQFLGGVFGSPLTGLLGPTALHLGWVVLASSAAALLLWSLVREKPPASV